MGVDRQLRYSLDALAVFAQCVFHYTKIETGDYDIVPAIADAAQGYVEHGDNAIAERIVAVESDGTEELLAFCVTGVVSACVRFLSREIDLAADASGDLIGSLRKEVDEGLFLTFGWQTLTGNLAVRAFTYFVSFFHQVEPILLVGRDFLRKIYCNH